MVRWNIDLQEFKTTFAAIAREEVLDTMDDQIEEDEEEHENSDPGQ